LPFENRFLGRPGEEAGQNRDIGPKDAVGLMPGIKTKNFLHYGKTISFIEKKKERMVGYGRR
jgi:hypothetical protein